jgi:hypothetical protein
VTGNSWARNPNLTGGFWTFMGNFDLDKAGFVIIGIFVLTWAAALPIWHFGHSGAGLLLMTGQPPSPGRHVPPAVTLDPGNPPREIVEAALLPSGPSPQVELP